MAFTIYADTNIYRYLASGELLITTVGDVRFVYSHVHFNEVMRGTNTDALDGMEVQAQSSCLVLSILSNLVSSIVLNSMT